MAGRVSCYRRGQHGKTYERFLLNKKSTAMDYVLLKTILSGSGCSTRRSRPGIGTGAHVALELPTTQPCTRNNASSTSPGDGPLEVLGHATDHVASEV